jgi:hypothetical protein
VQAFSLQSYTKTKSKCGILHKCFCKENCQDSQLGGKFQTQLIQARNLMQIKNLGVRKNNIATKNSWCSIISSKVFWHLNFKRFNNVLWSLEGR